MLHKIPSSTSPYQPHPAHDPDGEEVVVAATALAVVAEEDLDDGLDGLEMYLIFQGHLLQVEAVGVECD